MSNKNTLNLYLISQTVNNDYDTYDSAVVAEETAEAARIVHPQYDMRRDESRLWDRTWCPPSDVQVEYLGEAKPGTERGVICASFNAG